MEPSAQKPARCKPFWVMIAVVLALLCVLGIITIAHRISPTWKTRSVTEQTDALTLKSLECNTLLDPQGTTQETRILPPEGYTRTAAGENSFAAFLRKQPVYQQGSPIYCHDGTTLSSIGYAAVYRMDTGTANLQQCADSIIRLYSEYFLAQQMYDRIAFHTTSGFLLDYPSWRDGKRALVLGDFVTWLPLKRYDDSYATFLSYEMTVMRYAGTLSLTDESEPVALENATIGDFFCKGGSPGHVVLIVDEAVNAEGKRCFLLGQGFMPAQSFHILQNTQTDPWYYADEITFPFRADAFSFEEHMLRRWGTGFESE
ncbi:MAG: DUF4846 domain-containing protein [Oscillospiraceae bacterium]